MFTIKKSGNLALRRSTSTVLKRKDQSALGVDSRYKGLRTDAPYDQDKGFVSESYQMPSSLGPGSNLSSNAITIDTEPMLVGLTPQVESAFYRLYRDIYYFDSVAGSAVDLISQVTFSGEFGLGGINDAKVNAVYQEAIERLNTRTLLPEMSTDHLVLGAHCSSLIYNKTQRQFVDIMCHPIETLTVTDLPFYSQDPILQVTFNQQTKDAVSSTSETMKNIRELVGDSIIEKIKSGTLELDPLTTIYIPRKTFTYTEHGTSYYKRILPLYLIEKNLFRGTLVESARRQRGIMHLTLGDGDEWIPQTSDMEYITDLFMNADSDPLGAIIATRSGISVDEIRQGGDFWKVTDFADSVMPYKLRALGISEAFLSGEAIYNVADSSMTIFIEMLRSYRDMMTRKFFYERVFPLISMVNGYAVNARGKVTIREELKNHTSTAEALKAMNDGSKLLIPTVTWAKQLKPEGDSAYMDMLNTLSEKGVPVPLRVLAAAGGLNLDELLKQKDDDIAIREKLEEYTKALKRFQPREEESAEASALPLSSTSGSSAVLQRTSGLRPSLLSREFTGELYDRTKTGNLKSVSSKVARQRNHQMNKLIVTALKNNKSAKSIVTTPFNGDFKSPF